MPQGAIVPQVLVFQEFTQTATAITDPLRSFISGPCYSLFRYSEAAEKALAALGEYDFYNDEAFVWPNKPAGGVIDQTWTRLFFDNALLRYFEDGLGSGQTIEPVAGYANKIHCDTLIWRTGNGYSHSAILKDRGVTVGDVVHLRDALNNSLESTVVGFEADKAAAVVGSATQDAANKAAQSASASVSQTSGIVNQVDAAADGAAYDGRADGDIAETYLIRCIQGSIGGDAATALLEVISASGNDDDASVTPSAFGVATAIGSRGLKVTFDLGGSSSSGSPFDDDDFLEGQEWTVAAQQTFVKPTATAGGTYDGPSDTTYIAEVTRGGAYAGSVKPQVRITTTTGIDSSGPHEVTAAALAIAIGDYSLTIAFGNEDAGLCKGDRYNIAVTAEADAQIRTLLLGDNLSTAMRAALDLETKLFIKKNIEVDEDREGFAPLVNWSTSATEITVESGIIAYDSTWTSGGVLLAMNVMEADMFVQYRSLRAEFQSAVQTISDISLVITTLGPITADNPLALGVYLSLLNANGTDVKFMNTADTLAGHSEVINRILDRKDVYGLVPLTWNPNIQDLYQAHVDAYSTPEKAAWRNAWFSTRGSSTLGMRTTDSSGDPYLGTVEDDPDTSGTQYTIVKCTDGDFENTTTPVKALDIVRLNYVDDGFGNLSYEEYVVDAVVNANTLRLVTGPVAPISTPSKFEVWRNLSKDEIAASIALAAGVMGDRRVRNIWPDTVGWNGVDINGYFLCCALAGLRSGVTPQQGLTNVEIKGFDDLTRTTEYFNNVQLNAMAAAGTWIVTRADENAANPGAVYTRHQLTTDTSTIEDAEDSLVANPDAISYLFWNRLSGRIGTNNITPKVIQQIRTEIYAVFEYLKTAGYNDRIGGQIIDGDVVRIVQHPLLKDTLQAELGIEMPYPLNFLNLRIVFS